MMNRKKEFIYAITLSGCCALSSVSAGVLQDQYIGGDDHGWGDVIGDPNKFDIEHAEVTRNGTVVSVDIYTNFTGRGDDGLFTNLTAGPQGIGYGDLFLGNSWNPQGPAPFLSDNHATGNQWSYGLALDDRYSATGGTVSLFALNGSNDQNALLAEDFMSRGVFRNGQEIAVDQASNTTVELGVFGTWSLNTDGIYDGNDFIRFEIDLSGTSLFDTGVLALHWAMLCGNDVIEGGISYDRDEEGEPNLPVPEPLSASLLALGLLGMRRRQF